MEADKRIEELEKKVAALELQNMQLQLDMTNLEKALMVQVIELTPKLRDMVSTMQNEFLNAASEELKILVEKRFRG